ncbi:carbohydrate kinase [Citrobacter sp. RHBSTW-00903]|uniref:glycine-rich domain-containing protein n=1 Tax=Citrobacter sp. RHBSTW-00903 TaxID=2742670 RepID=UPI002017C5F2|nr:carbohydrate kinase [Citrobacter sp. RHBSTW-00903]
MLRIGQVEPSATADGKYTDGSVAGGIAATRLRAAAFNAMQEELANIVESAGMILSPDDMTQVLTALKKQLLSRANPFADIKADGTAAIAEALSNLGLVNNGAVGRLIGMQIIKTSGTYTKTPGAMFADVIAIGGGGGGGWATSTGNYNAAGGGGGGGGMARGLFNLSAISTVLVTIGAGGNGGIASKMTNGTQGGATTFGSYLSASGGQPGNGCTASGSSASCGMGGQGGTSTVGAILCNGYAGLPGVMATPTAVGGTVGSGLGGGSFISGPGGYGAGGNGAATISGNQNVNGGNGSAGVVIVMEYA